jgi:hypothetical protein
MTWGGCRGLGGWCIRGRGSGAGCRTARHASRHATRHTGRHFRPGVLKDGLKCWRGYVGNPRIRRGLRLVGQRVGYAQVRTGAQRAAPRRRHRRGGRSPRTAQSGPRGDSGEPARHPASKSATPPTPAVGQTRPPVPTRHNSPQLPTTLCNSGLLRIRAHNHHRQRMRLPKALPSL